MQGGFFKYANCCFIGFSAFNCKIIISFAKSNL